MLRVATKVATDVCSPLLRSAPTGPAALLLRPLEVTEAQARGRWHRGLSRPLLRPHRPDRDRPRLQAEHRSLPEVAHCLQIVCVSSQGVKELAVPEAVALGFGIRYYRTTTGFGVGSTIPLGRCHKTAQTPCEHRWHGFVFTPKYHDTPCACWIKVGTQRMSLPATATTFGKQPWFFIYTQRGRVTGFYFTLDFID